MMTPYTHVQSEEPIHPFAGFGDDRQGLNTSNDGFW